MEIEDRELVSRAIAGRTDDFRVLVERHQQSIFRFALRLLGNWNREVSHPSSEATTSVAARAHHERGEMTDNFYEKWLVNCRSASPPVSLVDQIMSQVANLERQRRAIWWLRLIERIEHSRPAR